MTSLLSEVGLNIQEAHAFSTVDGYSLDVFVVDGWPFEVSSSSFYCSKVLYGIWVICLSFTIDPCPGETCFLCRFFFAFVFGALFFMNIIIDDICFICLKYSVHLISGW